MLDEVKNRIHDEGGIRFLGWIWQRDVDDDWQVRMVRRYPHSNDREVTSTAFVEDLDSVCLHCFSQATYVVGDNRTDMLHWRGCTRCGRQSAVLA